MVLKIDENGKKFFFFYLRFAIKSRRCTPFLPEFENFDGTCASSAVVFSAVEGASDNGNAELHEHQWEQKFCNSFRANFRKKDLFDEMSRAFWKSIHECLILADFSRIFVEI